MISIQRILLPTDFSEPSEQARAYASEFVKRFEAELHLLHVVQPIALPGYFGPVLETVPVPGDAAQEELDKWDDPAFQEIGKIVRSVQVGTPFLEIVRYARAHDVDLIVMGTHGRSGIAQTLMGSVAEKVVRKAVCPVLTIHPEGHQFVMP